MEIKKNSTFDKNFKKRILGKTSLEAKFKERTTIFLLDRSNSILKDHKLQGKMAGLRSFSVTGDIRVIYIYISENEVLFIDIGSHNQVYS